MKFNTAPIVDDGDPECTEREQSESPLVRRLRHDRGEHRDGRAAGAVTKLDAVVALVHHADELELQPLERGPCEAAAATLRELQQALRELRARQQTLRGRGRAGFHRAPG